MIEYNSATKKFLKTLEKHFKNLHIEITTRINVKFMDKMSYEKNSATSVLSVKKIKSGNAGITLSYIEEGLNNIQTTNPELLKKYEDYRYIIDLIKGGHAFNEYDVLYEIFKDININESQQIEVLGYLLKHAASAFKSVEERIIEAKNDPNITVDRDFYMSLVTDDEEFVEKNWGASVVEKCKEQLEEMDLEQRFNEDIAIYKVIEQYIDDNGIFIGANETDALRKALSYKSIRMTESQINMIVKYVENKYIIEQEELNTQKTSVIEPTAAPVINLVDKKERWEASKILKSYLVTDLPIKMITSEEFVKITNALITLGYTDDQIARIQKNIVCNNEKLVHEEEEADYKKAKDKYLSETEIALLDSVEALIISEDSIVNPTFNIIKSDYEFVKSELTRLYKLNDDNNVDLNDNAELVIDAIEEISEKIPEYLYSDYRFTRNLTKKDDVNE